MHLQYTWSPGRPTPHLPLAACREQLGRGDDRGKLTPGAIRLCAAQLLSFQKYDQKGADYKCKRCSSGKKKVPGDANDSMGAGCSGRSQSA
jgi:hypothetical protein